MTDRLQIAAMAMQAMYAPDGDDSVWGYGDIEAVVHRNVAREAINAADALIAEDAKSVPETDHADMARTIQRLEEVCKAVLLAEFVPGHGYAKAVKLAAAAMPDYFQRASVGEAP